MDITFDLNELTVGDMEDVADIMKTPFEDLNWAKPDMKLMKAMLFVAGRRQNPDLTMDDVRNVRMKDIVRSEPDPT